MMFEVLVELRRIAAAQERLAENTERLLKAIEFIGERARYELGRNADELTTDQPPPSP